MFKESLLAAALTFPSWHGDTESTQQREVRLDTIVQAINDAALASVCFQKAKERSTASEGEKKSCRSVWRGDPRELAFLLLTQAFFETRLARHVHEGNCRSHLGECDSGKAISLWQLQSGSHLPKERWRALSGTDLASTTRAAKEAAKALGRGRNYCGNVTGAIGLYATGRTCRWEPAKGRARFMKRLQSRYSRAYQ